MTDSYLPPTLEEMARGRAMTDSTQELDEILCQAFYIEDGEYIGSYQEGTPIGFDIKQALLDWHNKQMSELLYRLLVEVKSAYDKEGDFLGMAVDIIEAERNKLKESK